MPNIETYFFVEHRSKCVWIVSYPGIDLKNAVSLLSLSDFRRNNKQHVGLFSVAYIMKQLFEAIHVGLGSIPLYGGHFGTNNVTNYAMVEPQSCRLIWTGLNSAGTSKIDQVEWMKHSLPNIGVQACYLANGSCGDGSYHAIYDALSAMLFIDYVDPTTNVEDAHLFKMYIAKLASSALSSDDEELLFSRFSVPKELYNYKESEAATFHRLYKKIWGTKTPKLEILPNKLIREPTEKNAAEWYTVDPMLSEDDNWNTTL